MSSQRSVSAHFLNRELSLLAFNRRVLSMVEDETTPILEQLRYLCIVSNNLDEFFEVRVAGLKHQMREGIDKTGPDGLSPGRVYALVCAEAHALVTHQYYLLNHRVLPQLADEGICFHRRGHWTEAQRVWTRDYFLREIMPVLTPIGLDTAHPFPRILNKSLNFAVELSGVDAFGRPCTHAVVQAPRALPRFIRLPEALCGCPYGFVFLSSILHANVGELFQGLTVEGCYQFRVTRNTELFLEDEDVRDLRLALQGELSHRQYGDEVRLEVPENCSEAMSRFLLNIFDLGDDDLYRVDGPVNLVRLMQVADMVDRPDLKYPSFHPQLPQEMKNPGNWFDALRKRDFLLHHPFQPFTPVIQFVQQAAQDPAVLAIKQTVYRTGADSELIEALMAAARNGKEVTVVVELLARFDEEANINWAEKLEQAGAHVVYGVFGYKTHAKLCLVIRRENSQLQRFAHLGTGNYHARTARSYTDFGLFTAHPDITADVSAIFMQITGLGRHENLRYLWQAPFTLHTGTLEAIAAERRLALNGQRAHIIAKMNALTEPEVIEALYAASQAGVRIDLIVRGVCLLRPGVKGLSEHIRVRSLIGRFLEHHRIMYFRNGGDAQIFIASADWMERNFFRRIEVCVPILDPRIKRRILREGLRPYLRDNSQAWVMNAEGRYQRLHPRAKQSGFIAQADLLRRLGRAPETS
ncbi:MAG: polyphosphate kinase 1 [Ferrovum sp.]|nr:polyphosphate kinase 1 [Ferrovum sp.]